MNHVKFLCWSYASAPEVFRPAGRGRERENRRDQVMDNECVVGTIVSWWGFTVGNCTPPCRECTDRGTAHGGSKYSETLGAMWEQSCTVISIFVTVTDVSNTINCAIFSAMKRAASLNVTSQLYRPIGLLPRKPLFIMVVVVMTRNSVACDMNHVSVLAVRDITNLSLMWSPLLPLVRQWGQMGTGVFSQLLAVSAPLSQKETAKCNRCVQQQKIVGIHPLNTSVVLAQLKRMERRELTVTCTTLDYNFQTTKYLK